MLLVVQPNNIEVINNIFKKWDLEHNIIGKVTMSGNYNVSRNSRMVFSSSFNSFKEEDNNLDLMSSKKEYDIRKVKDNKLWESYDSSIGMRTIKGSDKPGSYSILSIYENNKELVITWGDNVEDCYGMAKRLNSFPLGIVNCLNFGDPKSCIGDFKDSIEYMNGDPHHSRFMSYLSLFTGFMLVLVSADNFIVMFFGWEGIGLASFLLISF